MGMTLAEKILARASGRERVAPDEIVVAEVDLAMSHENADLVRKAFQRNRRAKCLGPRAHRDHSRSPRAGGIREDRRHAQSDPRIRGRAGNSQLLRRGPRRHLPPGAGGERPRAAWHGGGGHGLPHHHPRRFRRLRHRHRRHRDGGRVDGGQAVVQSALHHSHRDRRQARQVDLGEGPDALRHRQAGRRRRRLSRRGVRRAGHPPAQRRLAHGAYEPGHGDGRQGRLHAGGRPPGVGPRAARGEGQDRALGAGRGRELRARARNRRRPGHHGTAGGLPARGGQREAALGGGRRCR